MINGEGTGRNSSVVASSDPFDGFPPRLGQKSDTGDVSPALLEQSSFGESLLSHEESSPFGVICSESKDENFPTLEPSSDINTSLYMGTYDDYNGDDFMLSRGDSGLGLLTNSAENNSSQEIIRAENDVEKLVKFGVVNESSFMPGSNDDSSPDMAVCEEHFTEHVDTDLGNFDELTSASGIPFNGRKFRRMKEAEEEISSSYEHSDDDNSLVDYGTDDEQTGLYNKRNLQYYKKAKTENENPLLINSGVAFGSDDWEQFEQEVKENSLVSVLLDRPQDPQQPHPETERNLLNSAILAQSDSPVFDGLEEEENVIDIPIANCKVQGPNESMDLESCSIKNICAVQKDPPMLNPPVGTGLNIIDGTAERELQFISGEEASVLGESEVPKSELFEKLKLQNHLDPLSDTAVIQLCPTATETPKGNGTGYLEDHELDVLPPVVESIHKTCLKRVVGEEVSGLDESEVFKSKLMGKSKLRHQQDPLPDTAFSRLCSIATETPQGKEAGNLEDNELDALPPIVENNYETSLKRIVTNPSSSKDLVEDHAASIEVSSIKVEDLEFSESYDEIVHEMEEILLDCRESPGAWVTKGNRASSLQLPKAFRDGSSTASTSGTDDAYPQIEQPLKIDGVEVVGAKQKKGEVSLGERLVGVKEYTVYVLRVWSGKDQWEVERRYRDFFVLYRQLKTFFTDQGQNLPSPWSSVERESRKIFGNASPDVITERSALIQDCLRSILHSGFSSSTPMSLIWFLSPQETLSSSSVLNTLVPNSPSAFTGGTCTEVVSTLGNTISLLVEIPPHKSMKQLIESQHYSCAGCHKHFNDGKTLLREFVETFGWGKPRLCEYTGQLFCASCHTNETAVLPARVLHFWDFTQYPVSQLAKSYLDSIYDQPMLCVSAVNPFLFSRIPALLHIMSIRKKIGAMLPYVHCPFRKSILGGLGSRRYLVESNDFFALRDLVDLSKGAFAALPIMVETVSKKILDHITEQCLVCCDVGVPCGARSACEDPPSLIFPFQEAEVERCNSCESVFHKPCFRKLTNCPCSVNLEVDQGVGPSDMPKQRASDEVDGTLDLLARRPDSRSTMSFLSGLFSKAGQEKVWGPRNNHPVILMGSLPSSAL